MKILTICLVLMLLISCERQRGDLRESNVEGGDTLVGSLMLVTPESDMPEKITFDSSDSRSIAMVFSEESQGIKIWYSSNPVQSFRDWDSAKNFVKSKIIPWSLQRVFLIVPRGLNIDLHVVQLVIKEIGIQEVMLQFLK